MPRPDHEVAKVARVALANRRHGGTADPSQLVAKFCEARRRSPGLTAARWLGFGDADVPNDIGENKATMPPSVETASRQELRIGFCR